VGLVVDFGEIFAYYIQAYEDQPFGAQRTDLRADPAVAVAQLNAHAPTTGREVSTRFPGRMLRQRERNRLAIYQEDALVSLRYLRDKTLRHDEPTGKL
jgi:hypothetical protein